MSYLGDFPVGATVRFKFATRSQVGARTDQSSAWEAADLRVYRDDSTTERSSTSGFTITGPFDSMTGITHVAVDLADNTDAGFFAAGHDYQAVLFPDETIDGQSVAEVVAMWSIDNRGLIGELNRSRLLGTVDAGADATTIPIKTLNATLVDVDQLKGRVILFDRTTATAALQGQGAPIDGSTTTEITLAAGDALSSTPAEDDSFTIV